MSQKLKHDAGPKETVLLRQAVPKYNFIAHKLPKESSNIASTALDSVVNTSHSSEHNEADYRSTALSHTSAVTHFSHNADSRKQKPVAVVGASMQVPLTLDYVNEKASTERQRQSFSAPNSQYSSTYLPPATTNHDYGNTENHSTSAKGNVPVNASHYMQHMCFTQSPGVGHPTDACVSVTKATCQTVSLPGTYSHKGSFNLAANEHLTPDEHFKIVESERDKLKKDLEVQLKVNSELKRLLVASVGDDLSQRVETLCRDRAQLSLDLGGFSKKMSEEYENLDKVSIQADMWRSKYLASRVMIEELGNARAFYSLQCHDTQDALQQLLNERHELRTNLMEVHRVLQHVKSAFDPLNSQRSSTLRSTNVLDLSRSCQQLAEAMRFRLLPAHVAISTDEKADDSLWVGSVTHAEQYAHEILSRPEEPPGSIQSGSSRLVPLAVTPDSPVNRFHPHTRHENLTYNCCATCKGEISVV